MPRLGTWFVRASLVHLGLGFSLGAWILAYKGLPFGPPPWRWLPAHVELLLVGWMAQLAMGVAFWILPRIRSSRGDTRPAWAAFGLLNGGLLLVVAGMLDASPGWFAVLGRTAEAASAAAFALHAWPRVRPAHRPPHARGEMLAASERHAAPLRPGPPKSKS